MRAIIAVLYRIVFVIGCFASVSSKAEDLGSAYYRGKQLTIIVGDTAGSAYVSYAQLVQRHLGKHLPGAPTINIKLMPGAGSLIAANYLSEVAPRDGTVIAALYRGAAVEPLLSGSDFAGNFASRKLIWLYSLNHEVSLALAWHKTGIKNASELRDRELIVPIGGVTGDASIFGTLLNTLAHTRFKMICCFQGTAAQDLAMERGEIDGRLNFSWDNLKRARSDWLRDQRITPLLQFSTSPHPELLNLPLATELIDRDEDRKIMEIVLSRQTMGRPYAAPEGTPAEIIEILRSGFEQMVRDATFLADAEQSSLEINSPMHGRDIEVLLRSIYSTPPLMIERLITALKVGETRDSAP